ncbi:hypothetical protein [Nannocystis pusilla]|uniref:hypothetical protein n=1 Tax=Nannocystis pusilla TaxID=889268 RepID=UPI003B7FB8CA
MAGPAVEVAADRAADTVVAAKDGAAVGAEEVVAGKDVDPGTEVVAGKDGASQVAEAAQKDVAPPAGSTVELEALGRVLAGEDAEVIEVVDRRAVGREELVLLRWYGARAWQAQERRAGRLEAALTGLEAQVDACEATPGSSACASRGRSPIRT